MNDNREIFEVPRVYENLRRQTLTLAVTVYVKYKHFSTIFLKFKWRIAPNWVREILVTFENQSSMTKVTSASWITAWKETKMYLLKKNTNKRLCKMSEIHEIGGVRHQIYQRIIFCGQHAGINLNSWTLDKLLFNKPYISS
jgi:hypothetical protein